MDIQPRGILAVGHRWRDDRAVFTLLLQVAIRLRHHWMDFPLEICRFDFIGNWGLGFGITRPTTLRFQSRSWTHQHQVSPIFSFFIDLLFAIDLAETHNINPSILYHIIKPPTCFPSSFPCNTFRLHLTFNDWILFQSRATLMPVPLFLSDLITRIFLLQ